MRNTRCDGCGDSIQETKLRFKDYEDFCSIKCLLSYYGIRPQQYLEGIVETIVKAVDEGVRK